MRILTLLTLLAMLILPACTSEKHHDIQKSQSIKDITDAATQSAPLVNTIPVQMGLTHHGKLEVFGSFQTPSRLRLTVSLPDNGKLINTYYFLNGALARATTQRYPEPYIISPGGTVIKENDTPSYTNDVFFDQDQIIGRHSSGDPGDTARIEPNFPDRLRIDQFLANTRASSIYIDPQ